MIFFKVLLFVSVAFWLGGLMFWSFIVLPIAFKSFPKAEAGRFVSVIFPAADYWAVVFAVLTVTGLGGIFLGFYGTTEALMLEIPVGIMFLLTLHTAVVLHPRIQALRRKLQKQEFQETAHLDRIRFDFDRLHHRSVWIQMVIFILGFYVLGALPLLIP